MPRSTTFVSPATTATPAAARGRGHRRDDPPQVGDREALLDHEPGRQPQRPRAAHREVVHGAVDRQLADVAAGELERVHDVAVGREREPPDPADDGRVAELGERVVAELREEERLDEVAGRLAAGAVRERDQLVPERRRRLRANRLLRGCRRRP